MGFMAEVVLIELSVIGLLTGRGRLFVVDCKRMMGAASKRLMFIVWRRMWVSISKSSAVNEGL